MNFNLSLRFFVDGCSQARNATTVSSTARLVPFQTSSVDPRVYETSATFPHAEFAILRSFSKTAPTDGISR